MPGSVVHSSLLRNLTVVGLVAVLLTLIMAWPVIEQPTELLFGSEIVGRHSDAYTVIRGFSEPQPLGSLTQPGVDWVGAWLARWVGPVAAYNLLVLASFPLAALATFALAAYLGLNRWAAAWVGLLYAFSPLHIAHSAYHPHVAQMHWIPLALLALIAACDRWTPLRALGLVLVLLLGALSNFYLVLMLGAVVPPVMWVVKRHPVRSGEGWRPTLATLAAVAVLSILYASVFHRGIIQDPLRLAFPAADAQKYSARWYAYLTPPVEHPLLGSLGQAVWAVDPPGDSLVEQHVYLGWSAVVLAVLAIVAWRRRPAVRPWTVVPVLLVLAAVGLLLSLAPVWRLGALALPAPSWILRAVAPMFRAYARFGFLLHLGVLLLGGLLWTAWGARVRAKRSMAVPALVALAVIEFAPFPPWRAHPLYPHAGYRVLEAAGTSWSVLDCTLRPEILTSVATLVDRPVHAVEPDTNDCGEPDLAAKLAAQGITHAFDRVQGPLHQRPGFTPLDQRGDVVIYEVDSPPAQVYVRRWSGFSWREGKGRDSLRWAGAQPALWLSNTARQPTSVTVEFELAAFPESRAVEVVLNGDHVATIEVPGVRTWFALELPLGEVRNRMQFLAEGPPVTPDSLLGNGDRRRLAIAVGGIRYPRGDRVEGRSVAVENTDDELDGQAP